MTNYGSNTVYEMSPKSFGLIAIKPNCPTSGDSCTVLMGSESSRGLLNVLFFLSYKRQTFCKACRPALPNQSDEEIKWIALHN